MMQVLKLTYIAHGWSLAILNAPLIKDPVQAWRHGPVIPNLYRALKKYGSRNIDEFIYDPHSGAKIEAEFTSGQDMVITTIYEVYSDLHAFQLSDLTHKPGTPWDQKYDPDEMFTVIPNPMIASYYRQLSQQDGAA